MTGAGITGRLRAFGVVRDHAPVRMVAVAAPRAAFAVVKAAVAAAVLVLAAAAVGCGGGSGGSDASGPAGLPEPTGEAGASGEPGAVGDRPTEATLVLDYLPNGVHAGVYRALAAGYYEDAGIDLKVVTPTSTADTLRFIQAGKADFGLADGIDIVTQISEGRDAKAIMAVLQRPAGGLITLAGSRINSPGNLAEETVGVTGVPSDEAVFETMVENAGGDPGASKVVTLGFNGVQALRAGRVAAFTGYVPADATAIEAAGQPTRSFFFDRFGGPSYPGLVVFSTRSRIAAEPALMEGFVKATVAGYRDALRNPGRAVDDLTAATEGVDRDLALSTFRAYKPLIGPPGSLGRLNRRRVADLSRFLVEENLIENGIVPARYATNRFVPGSDG